MEPTSLRAELRRARRFARPLQRRDRAPALPPALPPGRTVVVPHRGELFLREATGNPDGPPIVLLHGWTASADSNWFRVYDAVAERGRMLAVDHRGHGRGIRTDRRFTLEDVADDVAGLLRHLGTGPAVLVGYSMGGPVAMLTAQRHPDVVAGLVLQATALEWRASRRERTVWKFMAVLEYVLRLGRPRGLVERWMREALERDPDLHAVEPWLRGEMRRGDPEAIADAGRALGSFDARPFAAGLRVPAAVVVTTRDRLVRPRKQRALAKALADAEVFEVAADHDACLVEPGPFRQATAEALDSVIRRLEGRAPATVRAAS